MRLPLVVRRVSGHSMEPILKDGQLIFASPLLKPGVGKIVIAKNRGLEVVKRVESIDGQTVKLRGDNPHKSHNVTVDKAALIAVKFG